MTTKIDRDPEQQLRCKGGLSFRCNHGPYKTYGEFSDTHSRHRNQYYCRNCKVYLGCEKCCQVPQEIVCLRCNEWGLTDGEREHGKMLSKELIREKWHSLTSNLTRKMEGKV